MKLIDFLKTTELFIDDEFVPNNELMKDVDLWNNGNNIRYIKSMHKGDVICKSYIIDKNFDINFVNDKLYIHNIILIGNTYVINMIHIKNEF